MDDLRRDFFDNQVKAQIDLMRYGEDLRRRVVGILSSVQADIKQKIIMHDPGAGKTKKARALRLIRLNRDVGNVIQTQFSNIKSIASEELEGLAIVEGQRIIKDLNKMAGGINLFDITLDQVQMASIANQSMIDGRLIGDWWQKKGRDFHEQFEAAMTDATEQVQIGSVQGESWREMVGRVEGGLVRAGIINTVRHQATSLVLTSVMQVANDARGRVYRENEDLIDGYQVLVTLDGRTSDFCRALGSIVGIAYDLEFKPVGHSIAWRGFPAHWRCRSTYMPVLKSWADLAGPRSKLSKKKLRELEKVPVGTRSAFGGPVPADTSYDAWLKKRPRKEQVKILGIKRYQVWKKGKLSMRDLVNQGGNTIPIKRLYEKHGIDYEKRLPAWYLAQREKKRPAPAPTRSPAKDVVKERKETVRERLRSPQEQEIRGWLNRYRNKHPDTYPERERRLIDNWVRGSKRKVCIEMKAAAIREFGLKGLPYSRVNYNLDEALIEATRKDLRAMHTKTQEYFKSRGITHLRLYRGVQSGYSVPGSISAYSTSEKVARGFDGHDVIAVDVPIEKILVGKDVDGWIDGPWGNQEEWLVLE